MLLTFDSAQPIELPLPSRLGRTCRTLTQAKDVLLRTLRPAPLIRK